MLLSYFFLIYKRHCENGQSVIQITSLPNTHIHSVLLHIDIGVTIKYDKVLGKSGVTNLKNRSITIWAPGRWQW